MSQVVLYRCLVCAFSQLDSHRLGSILHIRFVLGIPELQIQIFYVFGLHIRNFNRFRRQPLFVMAVCGYLMVDSGRDRTFNCQSIDVILIFHVFVHICSRGACFECASMLVVVVWCCCYFGARFEPVSMFVVVM